jgi:hypothetical protein
MRFFMVALLCIGLLIGAASAAGKSADKFVQPVKDSTAVYKSPTHEASEQPIGYVNSTDKLIVMGSDRTNYKIQIPSGPDGWIEKNLVVVAGKNNTLIFDDAEVIGYLDNPTPVYIIDSDNPNSDPIKLDRTFANVLTDNLDRNTVERMTAK